jgi:hypothetical protein
VQVGVYTYTLPFSLIFLLACGETTATNKKQEMPRPTEQTADQSSQDKSKIQTVETAAASRSGIPSFCTGIDGDDACVSCRPRELEIKRCFTKPEALSYNFGATCTHTNDEVSCKQKGDAPFRLSLAESAVEKAYKIFPLVILGAKIYINDRLKENVPTAAKQVEIAEAILDLFGEHRETLFTGSAIPEFVAKAIELAKKFDKDFTEEKAAAYKPKLTAILESWKKAVEQNRFDTELAKNLVQVFVSAIPDLTSELKKKPEELKKITDFLTQEATNNDLFKGLLQGADPSVILSFLMSLLTGAAT